MAVTATALRESGGITNQQNSRPRALTAAHCGSAVSRFRRVLLSVLGEHLRPGHKRRALRGKDVSVA